MDYNEHLVDNIYSKLSFALIAINSELWEQISAGKQKSP